MAGHGLRWEGEEDDRDAVKKQLPANLETSERFSWLSACFLLFFLFNQKLFSISVSV